jgi:flagellar basal body-associated protein FliL
MKRNYKKLLWVLLLVIIVTIVFQADAVAQCPMCRMSAESNLKNGGTEGRALNTGILYMLAMPYLLVGILGYVWWKKRKKEEADSTSQRPL